MKKVIFISALFLFGIFIPDAKSQIVVKVRPARPAVVVKKPVKVRRGHVWREGHWVYSNKKGKYIWRKGQWVKKRPGKVRVKGHWKSVPGGQRWVPGHWR